MGQNLNIQMQEFNGTDYNLLYPITLPANVQGGVYTINQTFDNNNQSEFSVQTPSEAFDTLSAFMGTTQTSLNNLQTSVQVNITQSSGSNVYTYTTLSGETLPIGNCQILLGNYVGTGSYGSNNPTQIVFPFPPKIVIMAGPYGWSIVSPTGSNNSPNLSNPNTINMDIAPTDYDNNLKINLSGGQCVIKKSMDGKTLTWYTLNGSAGFAQNNAADTTYYWVAWG